MVLVLGSYRAGRLAPELEGTLNDHDFTRFGPVVRAIASGPVVRAYATHHGWPPGESSSGEKLDRQEIFAPAAIVDDQMADCCISGLLLLQGRLDASHRISQRIQSPEGSFWHAIMHRIEGDFGNSKYWYRNVGPHPVYSQLLKSAQGIAATSRTSASAKKLIAQQRWEPAALVDWVQAVASGDDAAAELCRRVCLAEWFVLFSYCFVRAAGDRAASR